MAATDMNFLRDILGSIRFPYLPMFASAHWRPDLVPRAWRAPDPGSPPTTTDKSAEHGTVEERACLDASIA